MLTIVSMLTLVKLMSLLVVAVACYVRRLWAVLAFSRLDRIFYSSVRALCGGNWLVFQRQALRVAVPIPLPVRIILPLESLPTPTFSGWCDSRVP